MRVLTDKKLGIDQVPNKTWQNTLDKWKMMCFLLVLAINCSQSSRDEGSIVKRNCVYPLPRCINYNFVNILDKTRDVSPPRRVKVASYLIN